MLTLTADYALRAVLVLAREPEGRSMHAERIAEAIDAPRNYLSKTMNTLAKAGIVHSTRGPQGGFSLAVPPHQLFIARIVDVFEEPRPHTKCLLGRRPCTAADPCAAHERWARMMRAARESLSNTSIADLLTAEIRDPRPETRDPRPQTMTKLTHTSIAFAFTAAALLGTATIMSCTRADAAESYGRGVPVRTPSDPIQGQEVAALTDAPNVPPAITRNHATKVIVNLDVIEKTVQIADSVEYTVWTFGGSVPGKFIRVREGDLVELHLRNAANSTMPHNIDLHAVTGPGGGAKTSMTIPGHESIFTFTAMNPGLFIYHCATSPVPMHMSNGMYGMILVEPKGGLPKVDREYYVMQSEFYTKGKYGEHGLQQLDMDKGVEEKPTYVVFNGAVGAIAGDKALQAKVGERVRLFVGDAGPNLTSSFHVIGEIFDNVYGEGGSTPNQHNVQTTLIPSGGATIVEFGVEKPGDLILVDHSIFRAFNQGALGMIHVTGNDNPKVFAAI